MKLKISMNKSLRAAILVAILITLIFGTLLVIIKDEYNAKRTAFQEDAIQKYNEQYQTIVYGYRLLAKSYYDKIISNERILEIMREANYGDDEKKDLLRNELYDLSLYDYERAANDHFYQYQFVLNNDISFLRMHTPTKYGDDLSDVRESVRIANEEGIYVEGFEEGKTLNGYRFVYPLFYKDESIGCVEVTLSHRAVMELMMELFNTRTKFLANKQIADENVWPYLVDKIYEKVPFSENYYIEIATKQQNPKREDSNTGILELIDSNIELNGDNLYLNIKRENINYSIVFLNISNIKKEHAGYLVFVNESTRVSDFDDGFQVMFYGIILVWILVISIIILFVNNKIKVDQITYFDKLTNAYNRNKMYDFIELEMKRDCRYNTNLSLILFDVDDFKIVNDTFGHIIGDEVLKQLCKTVQANIRSNDILFRYGGDEFLILLPGTDSFEAKLLAIKLRDILNLDIHKTINKSISISMGIVQYDRLESLEHLIQRADVDLYEAKKYKPSNI